MKNIYFSSTLLWNFSIEKIIKLAAEYKYEGVEIWAEHFWFNKFSIEDTIRLKEKYRLEILLHSASWDLNIASINDGIKNQSIEEIKKSILLAKEVGAKKITIHPGRESLNRKLTEWHINILKESLESISEFAYKNSVGISLELMEPEAKEIVHIPKVINSILESLNFPMGITFDIAHLKEESLMEPYIDELKNVDKIHVSNKKGDKYHVLLPEGDYDCKNMIKQLLGYNVPIVIEGYDESHEMDSFIKNTEFMKRVLR